MTIWSLDTESYYDAELSIKTLGVYHYVFHPAADHYLVSVAGSDGTRYVGVPEGAPWEKMAGGIWVSANVGYDGLVKQRLVRDSRIPNVHPFDWHDAADLSAYLGYPRALKQMIQAMYGVAVSKDVRDKMKGKRWSEMSPEFRRAVEEYALTDAEWPLRVWQDHNHKWPEKERILSRLTREMGWRGVRIDIDLVDRYIRHLKLMCWAAEQKIPFRPALSLPKLAAACRDAGIDVPASLAKDSEESEAWEDKYAHRFAWVGAMRILRRCNALCKKLETIRSRVREDGTVPTDLKYFGAGITGRWSGAGGVNWQNLPRQPLFDSVWWNKEAAKIIGDLVPAVTEGVDLRRCIIPREGNHFLTPDLEQIEPRCSAVIVKDQDFVKLLESGQSPYVAHAISTGMYDPSGPPLTKANPLYALAKARELALSYNAGHHKFIIMAPMYISVEEVDRIFSAPVTDGQIKAYEKYLLDVNIPTWNAKWKRADDKMKVWLVNSWLIVEDFREKKPKTKAMWKRLQHALERAVGEDLEIELPSGRIMRYANVKRISEDFLTVGPDGKLKKETHTELTAVTPSFGKLMRQKFYGGALFNNLIQGTAREIFAECWLRLAAAGYEDNIVMSVHDELVLDIDRLVQPDTIRAIMGRAPEWMPMLPVTSSCESHEFYTK